MNHEHKRDQFIMAPMRGYTDAVFRDIWAKHFSGMDEAVAPFISLQQAKDLSSKILADVAQKGERSIPVIPQILGNSSQAFVALACRLADLGFQELNWNLGCPFPMVAKKTKGSGLLCFPERIDAFLEEACALSPLGVSVKMRLGRHDSRETTALLEVLNRYPLERIILHPRVGVQMYEGRPDLEAFRSFLRDSNHQVIYNGDIWSKDDFMALSTEFPGVKGWMLGRGLLADPFLAERLRGTFHSGDQTELIRFRSFYDDLENAYGKRLSGDSHLLSRMKGWWLCFQESFENGTSFFKSLRKLNRMEVFRREVTGFLDSKPRWRMPEAAGWVKGSSLFQGGKDDTDSH
ncbi:tRNA-dihydrouridine synthase family protein [Desulfobotulus sp. H1]|uniref:tRNA-dihydrouridine synthase n=1 Tax=Desulfobotulus pelophilus TaxID=2823377 RepID=A0ABT3N8C2_9BACT|nr:tRNA-dihydrouridine synthase family protein [Desulfobotulus pelophilus]MCW7753703.1 tRNA-dihydrouridine synthase family protein [Desulfobotulus pelophilus]